MHRLILYKLAIDKPSAMVVGEGLSQCGNWATFSAILILREINFGSWYQKVKKCHFNNFGGFEYWFLEKFHTWKCQTFPKIQNSEVLKWSKWQFLGLQNDPNWFHVKSKRQINPHCLFPIRLPRSVTFRFLLISNF